MLVPFRLQPPVLVAAYAPHVTDDVGEHLAEVVHAHRGVLPVYVGEAVLVRSDLYNGVELDVFLEDDPFPWVAGVYLAQYLFFIYAENAREEIKNLFQFFF